MAELIEKARDARDNLNDSWFFDDDAIDEDIAKWMADFADLHAKAEVSAARAEIAADLKKMRQQSPGLNKTSNLGQALAEYIDQLSEGE